MQAQAGLAARKAKLEQAQQTAFDYASRISSLYSRSSPPANPSAESMTRGSNSSRLYRPDIVPCSLETLIGRLEGTQ
jgi:hypothetical protein